MWSSEEARLLCWSDLSVRYVVEPPRSSLARLTSPYQGKSVLLRSLLGETYLSGGSISSTSAQFVTAYAAQDAFILPTSIRENILLCSRYDPGWYAQVISACSLAEDLEAFHSGDATIVGEGGQECSGGQKQRIVRLSCYVLRMTLTHVSFS